MEVVLIRIELETDRLILRELLQEDATYIAEKISPLNVSRYLAVVPHPYKLEHAQEFIGNILLEQGKEKRKGYELAITMKPMNCTAQTEPLEAIGIIALKNIDYFNQTAELGYWLGKDYWGQGLVPEAAKKMLEFAFNELKLNRINVKAAIENKASNRVIQKLGFVFEGTKKQEMRSRATNKLHDANEYGLLKEDWEKKGQ